MKNTQLNNGKTSYTLKSGKQMRQINLAVSTEVADKFEELCKGLSKSTIFSQLIDEKHQDCTKNSQPSVLTGL